MIETNLPQSGDDNAPTASSGGSQPPEDGIQPAEDTTDETPAYLPRFSRERLTRRQWQLAFTLMIASVLICVAVVVSNVIRVPYVSLSPGSVYSLSEAVYVDGGDGEFAIYPPESDMGFVTVRRSHKLTLWRLFIDSLDTRIDIDGYTDIYQGRSQEEIDRLRSVQMQGSQGDAVEIALRHLGRTRVTLMPDSVSADYEDTLSCFLGLPEEEETAENLQRFMRSFFPRLPDGTTAVNPIAGLRLLADSGNGYLRETLSAHWQSFAKFLLGDTVVSANGKPVESTADMRAALEGIEPGESVSLEMQFFDQPVRRVVAEMGEGLVAEEGLFSLVFEDLGLSDGAGAGQGVDGDQGADGGQGAGGDQGVDLECPEAQTWLFFDWPDLELVSRVSFDTGDVGGPSAGLAFALAVVDLLTEGDLTGGLRVATTGIFRSHRSDEVSSVGGVSQKTAAVRNSGYDVFLVPENDYDKAVSAAGDDLRVEKVTTLRDALAVLECLGGDPVLLGDGSPRAGAATAETGASEAAAGAAAETAELAACS